MAKKKSAGSGDLVIVESPAKAKTIEKYLGDGFTVLTAGAHQVGGPIDLDALIGFLATQSSPLTPPVLERIPRLN